MPFLYRGAGSLSKTIRQLRLVSKWPAGFRGCFDWTHGLLLHLISFFLFFIVWPFVLDKVNNPVQACFVEMHFELRICVRRASGTGVSPKNDI
jgi:hypothetical protein